jgi:hypothetical protein
VHRDNPTILSEKPQHAGIELAHVTQFKQSIADRLRQWLPVILPAPQFCQTGDHRSEVVRIAGLQLVKELPHGA